jgi:hypothetical protein
MRIEGQNRQDGLLNAFDVVLVDVTIGQAFGDERPPINQQGSKMPGRGSLSTAKRFRLRLTPTQKRKCPRTSGKSRCMCSECGATHSKQASIDCAALVGSAAFMCLTRTDYQRSDAITQAGPQRGSRRCSDSWLVSVGYRLGPRTILEPPEGEEAVVECHPSGPFRLAERRRLLGDLSVLP